AFEQKPLLGKATRHVAVSGVTLAVRRGEVFGLAGESGSGKTTIARMIMGLIVATEGSVTVDGKADGDERGSVAFRREVATVYQNTGVSLISEGTVGETLRVPLAFAGMRGKACDERIA